MLYLTCYGLFECLTCQWAVLKWRVGANCGHCRQYAIECGQNVNKGPWQPAMGSITPGTCYFDLFVENKTKAKRTYQNTMLIKLWGGGWGQTQSYLRQTTRVNLHSNNSKCACIKQSPTGQQKISQLTMIIDNLILKDGCLLLNPTWILLSYLN